MSYDHCIVARFTHRGLTPHKFTPMPGVHLKLPESAFDAKAPPNYQAKAFVVRLNNDLTRLISGTFLGGDYPYRDSDDEIYDMAIDPNGNIWVAGQTNSFDFPVTQNAIQRQYFGKGDGFVARFNSDLSELQASTFLGSMNQEVITAMAIDSKGRVFVGGWTESSKFPMVKGGFDTRYSHEEEDAFIVKVSHDLKRILASIFLGGNYDASGYGDDFLSSLALSEDGKRLAVTGRTESENFPVTEDAYKAFTNDLDNPTIDSDHRNIGVPRENRSSDPDYGDGYIAVFDSDLKTLHYSTYLGGYNLEYTDDILWDGKELLIAGITYSHAFPYITQKETDPWSKGFVIRFDFKKNQ